MPVPLLPIYLDCNATTPMEPEVREVVMHFMTEEFGNAGSRTHEYGLRAKQAVQRAREQVATVVGARGDDVLFTSGATESNNLAVLGLAPHGERTGRRHVITTAIEHKAVLEPVEELGRRGFEVTILPVTGGGWVDPECLKRALRPDTILVSVMHVNNETGVIQPLDGVAEVMAAHEAFLHVDAAQGYGKELSLLHSPRIDMISVSGHKVYAPKGIGALISRRRGFQKPPLSPLMFGGGQEKGLRPGTLPVPLIAGLGAAARLSLSNAEARHAHNVRLRADALRALSLIEPVINGESSRTIASTLNLSIAGIDSEAAMLALKHVVALSNGSACTSQSYSLSHVLLAMGVAESHVRGALRLSWSHLTPEIPWATIADVLHKLR